MDAIKELSRAREEKERILSIFLPEKKQMAIFKIKELEISEDQKKLLNIVAFENNIAEKIGILQRKALTTMAKAKGLKPINLGMVIDGAKNQLYFINIESLEIITDIQEISISGITKSINS